MPPPLISYFILENEELLKRSTVSGNTPIDYADVCKFKELRNVIT
jgi:hypothetical protein